MRGMVQIFKDPPQLGIRHGISSPDDRMEARAEVLVVGRLADLLELVENPPQELEELPDHIHGASPGWPGANHLLPASLFTSLPWVHDQPSSPGRRPAFR